MQVVEEVRNLPVLRQDRVEEVKKRLQDPSYIDSHVVNSVADEIMSVFGIE